MVYTLVTHIGGGSRQEVDGAVAVLRSLAERMPQRLAKFVVLLKQVLDYLHNLSLQHVRDLFAVITRLSVQEDVRRPAGAKKCAVPMIPCLTCRSCACALSQREADDLKVPPEIHIFLRKMVRGVGTAARDAASRALAADAHP